MVNTADRAKKSETNRKCTEYIQKLNSSAPEAIKKPLGKKKKREIKRRRKMRECDIKKNERRGEGVCKKRPARREALHLFPCPKQQQAQRGQMALVIR